MGALAGLQVAGLAAGVLSTIVIFSCLVAVPSLISEINSIRSELEREMGEFRSLSGDLWKEMMGMGGSKRARRDAQLWLPRTAVRSVAPNGGYGGDGGWLSVPQSIQDGLTLSIGRFLRLRQQ